MHPERLKQAASSLRTFTEGVDSVEKDNMLSSFGRCETVLFLGFAFHSINMKLLLDQIPKRSAKTVLGTAYEISDFNRGMIEEELAQIRGDGVTSIYLENRRCAELIEQYSRVLKFSNG